jgi:hypothetical protein
VVPAIIIDLAGRRQLEVREEQTDSQSKLTQRCMFERNCNRLYKYCGFHCKKSGPGKWAMHGYNTDITAKPIAEKLMTKALPNDSLSRLVCK